jgi:hypothetical protein
MDSEVKYTQIQPITYYLIFCELPQTAQKISYEVECLLSLLQHIQLLR